RAAGGRSLEYARRALSRWEELGEDAKAARLNAILAREYEPTLLRAADAVERTRGAWDGRKADPALATVAGLTLGAALVATGAQAEGFEVLDSGWQLARGHGPAD